MITNVVRNPSAEGATASLAADTSSAVTMVADAVTGPGAKSYRLAASAPISFAAVRAAERLAATPGQRAWGRVRCRLDASVIGARKVSTKLVFRDSAGAILPHRQPTIAAAGGAFHRWLGVPHNSASERVENGTSRINLFPDPQVAGTADQWGTYYDPARTFETVTGPDGETVRAYVTTTTSTPSAPGLPQGFAVVIDTNSNPGSIVSAYVDVRGPAGSTIIVGGRSSGGESQSSYVHTFTGNWDRVGVQYAVTADVARTAVGLQLVKQRPQGYLSERFEFRRMRLEVDAPASAGSQHFDGSTPNTGAGYTDQASVDVVPSGVFHRFAGTAHQSTSERYDGTGTRYNYAPNPRLAIDSATWFYYGSPSPERIASAPGIGRPAIRMVRSSLSVSIALANAPATPGRRYVLSATINNPIDGQQTTIDGQFLDSMDRVLGNIDRFIGRAVGVSRIKTDSFVAPTGTVKIQFRAYRDSGIDGDTYVTDYMVESAPTAGPYFDGGTASSGTGNSQQVVDLVVGGDAPAGAATADLLVYRDPMYQVAATDVLLADSVLLAAATVGTTSAPPPYFDGSVSRYAAWTGTANASTSIYYETAPVLSPLTDDAPGPRILLNFVDFLPGTATATIHRLTDAADTIVPGADRAAALGGLIRTDYYAPFRSTVRYLAEMFTAAGVSLGFTETSNGYLDVGETYIASPVDPKQQVRVILDASAGSELENPVQASLHQINGRRILIAEADYGLSRLPMPFWTDTIGQYRQALAVFRSANSMVVVRTPPPMEVPRVLYCFGVPKRSETNLPMGIEEFYWDWNVEEVTPPTTQVITAQITYARFRNYFPTYAAFKAAYATYRAAQLAPPSEV